MKALIIEVKGAGFFPFHRPNGKMKSVVSHYNIPPGRLAAPNVANLLRVLCGERPVPSIRECNYNGDSYFEELAGKSRAIVHSFFEEDKKYPYPNETKACQKHVSEAWSPVKQTFKLNGTTHDIRGGFTWDRIHRDIGDELFNKMNNILESLEFEFSKTSTAKEGIEFLNNNKDKDIVKEFCEELVSNRKTSLRNVILNEEVLTKKGKKAHMADAVSFHCSSKACERLNGLMVGRWPDVISKIDATIVVPMDEELEMRISKGTGTATFMEGGLAIISDIQPWSNIIQNETQSLLTREEVYVFVESKANKSE